MLGGLATAGVHRRCGDAGAAVSLRAGAETLRQRQTRSSFMGVTLPSCLPPASCAPHLGIRRTEGRIQMESVSLLNALLPPNSDASQEALHCMVQAPHCGHKAPRNLSSWARQELIEHGKGVCVGRRRRHVDYRKATVSALSLCILHSCAGLNGFLLPCV